MKPRPRRRLAWAVSAMLAIWGAGAAVAQKPPVDVSVIPGVALAGADPVAYFNEGRYRSGSANITFSWMGALWRFASEANRDAFAGDPARFAPQYGGYCAWAVSQGYTARIDPQAWRVVDGKLYLNYSKSVQSRWERDISANIAKADGNWPTVLER